jgi:transcriptional regulator with XRE-family HTH domain
MEVTTLIRAARQVAGITQVELADRAGTAQPAVAAYESGGKTPNLATLERLLGACEHDIEVLARPRVRRDTSAGP